MVPSEAPRVPPRAEGCTVVLCTASACCTPLHLPLLTALRATIRTVTYGVLVTTGCMFGPVSCRARRSGPVVVVQPCDVDRRPVGCAVVVGPLQDDADVTTLGEWLRDGRFDPASLPAHLRVTHRAVHAAASN